MMLLEKIRGLHQDDLFRNSFYLMLNTGVMALFGFVFWIINARIFTPDQVGIATSLISAMTLISFASALGFDITFVRVLPGSKKRSEVINTGLLLSLVAAITLSIVYIAVIPHITPQLSVVSQSLIHSIIFILLVASAAINILTDSIFVAFRAAKYNLFIDGFLMGIAKLSLPFLFFGFGAYGLFSASGLAYSLALITSIIFLVAHFGYQPKFRIDIPTLRSVFKYSTSNYIAGLLNTAPTLFLPLIIIEHLGTASAGYYYLAFVVANILYSVAYAVSQSLLAEGSFSSIPLRALLKRSSIIICAIMIPASIIMAFASPYVLQLFGKSYAAEASQLILVFAIASPAVAMYALTNSTLRITDTLRGVIFTNAILAITTIGLTMLWIEKGIVWAGISWMLGNLAAAVAGLIVLAYSRYENFLPKNVTKKS